MKRNKGIRMGRPKVADEATRVSFVISRKQYEFLKLMAARQGVKEKTIITLSELVRRTMAECYPIPKNESNDLFE